MRNRRERSHACRCRRAGKPDYKKAPEQNATIEPTYACENVTNEATDAGKNSTNEATVAADVGPDGPTYTDAPTQNSTVELTPARESVTNEPTDDCETPSNEPTVNRENVTNEPMVPDENSTVEPMLAVAVGMNEKDAGDLHEVDRPTERRRVESHRARQDDGTARGELAGIE